MPCPRPKLRTSQAWARPCSSIRTSQPIAISPAHPATGPVGNDYGYEAKHVDISREMAELSLLPAVRGADDKTVIVADGTSCRHQIRDFADRKALHVARVLAEALEDSAGKKVAL